MVPPYFLDGRLGASVDDGTGSAQTAAGCAVPSDGADPGRRDSGLGADDAACGRGRPSSSQFSSTGGVQAGRLARGAVGSRLDLSRVPPCCRGSGDACCDAGGLTLEIADRAGVEDGVEADRVRARRGAGGVCAPYAIGIVLLHAGRVGIARQAGASGGGVRHRRRGRHGPCGAGGARDEGPSRSHQPRRFAVGHLRRGEDVEAGRFQPRGHVGRRSPGH